MGYHQLYIVPNNLAQRYLPWLCLFVGLFAIRIIAQPLTLLIDSTFLPPFESWHGGVLPYPLLLMTQLLILLWMIHTIRQFKTGAVTTSRRRGINVLVFAGIYFIAMFARLILGLTILNGQRWFASFLSYRVSRLSFALWLLSL